MIRTLQTIDWALLPPAPVALHPRLTVLAGQNGSGKSSSMDALKALLGVQRFGQGRSAASYIHDGRELTVPAEEAVVLGCCSLPSDRNLGFADSRGDFTLLLWVTRSRRAFLALPGHVLLGMGESSLSEDWTQLKERYPRRQWYSPEEYQKKVLDPLGATRSVQRILSIPQGHAQRLLDARPDQLLANLLGIMGALDLLQQLDQRRADYQQAQTERDQAHRTFLEEQLRLSQAERELDSDRALTSVQDALTSVTARARGSLAAAQQQASQEVQAIAEAQQQLAADRQQLTEAEQRLADQKAAAATAPEVYAAAQRAQQALAEAGVQADILLEQLTDQAASVGQISQLQHRLCLLWVPEKDWETALRIAADHPAVSLACGAEPLHWWEQMTASAQAEDRDSHVLLEEGSARLLVPALRVQLPITPIDPELEQQLRKRSWDLDRQGRDLRDRNATLQERNAELQRLAEQLGEGDSQPAEPEEMAGLLAEMSRLSAEQERLLKAEKRRQQQREALVAQRERMADAEQFLKGQEGALEISRAALSEAREMYQQLVRKLIDDLDQHFRQLCDDAGMRGELGLVPDPLAEAGGRLNVKVAESPHAPLRSYIDADLSGGWRSRTAVLVLLAALCAAGGRNTLPCALWDEHASQLDEEAINDIGYVMQELARTRGLQFIVTMPTKRANEASGWADLQIAYLKADPDQPYAPLPHLIEAEETATLRPAAQNNDEG